MDQKFEGKPVVRDIEICRKCFFFKKVNDPIKEKMMDGIGIDVYIKFGIHKNKAKVVVEFENFSFHPLQQQSSQRTENTGTSN